VAAGVPTIAVPHLVPIPARPGLVAVPTLHGIRAGDLLGILAGAVSPRAQ